MLGLFAASVFLVSQFRAAKYSGELISIEGVKQYRAGISGNNGMAILFVDRWVGIEGILAVSAYPKLGWPLWKAAWAEKYADTGASMYDLEIAKSMRADDEALKTKHFITMPGLLAFLYYPGSNYFLFLAMFTVCIFGGAFEFIASRLSGQNIFFTALIAQVVAYRIVHFGYVPRQSYLLFGSVIITIFLISMIHRVATEKSRQ
jgi:hypothetical protein